MPKQDGIYGRMEKKEGNHRHHFPPKIVYDLKDEHGRKLFEPTEHLSCAISMQKEAHKELGSSNMSKPMKKEIEQVAREKGFRAVKAWGIWEVRREYGRTYNKKFLESLKERRKLE